MTHPFYVPMNHVVSVEVFEAACNARYLVRGKNNSHSMQEGHLLNQAGLPPDGH